MRTLGCLVRVAALVAFSSWPAAAQQPASPSLEAQYDAAFEETLRQPANLDVLFRFASLASQTGDLEGAVSALERMLLIDPNLPRVRLELGVLYFRLGSYELARTYLEAALKPSGVPPEVRARAEQYIADLDKRLTRSRFSGELFLGARYQSNANLGPANSQVRLFGQIANLNQAALGTPDWGAVTSAQVRHAYDLGTQDKAALESQFTFYANRQFQVSAANVTLIDFTTGPRFQAFRETFEDVIVRPFVSAGYIWVKDTPYYGSYGAGVEAGALLTDRLRNVSIFSWRQQNYPNTSYLPTNSQFTGTQYSAVTTFQYQLTETVSLYAVGNAQRYQTQQTAWQNYTLLGAGGGMAFRFADPVFGSDLPWSLSLSVNQQWWRYDQPDPVVDPGTMRYQGDTILNLLLSIPFDERTTFTTSVGRFNRAASVPNYQFTNNSVLFGVGWRF
ncbi:MAG: tetratricopeptide repeat protein [Pseudomonadota bacterium]